MLLLGPWPASQWFTTAQKCVSLLWQILLLIMLKADSTAWSSAYWEDLPSILPFRAMPAWGYSVATIHFRLTSTYRWLSPMWTRPECFLSPLSGHRKAPMKPWVWGQERYQCNRLLTRGSEPLARMTHAHVCLIAFLRPEYTISII